MSKPQAWSEMKTGQWVRVSDGWEFEFRPRFDIPARTMADVSLPPPPGFAGAPEGQVLIEVRFAPISRGWRLRFRDWLDRG